jgi:hypothetical protein
MLYVDFGDMVPGHPYTFSAWFWIDNARNNAFESAGGIGVQVASSQAGLNATRYWTGASAIPGIGGDVGADGFAHSNCWPESGQGSCTVDKTWFKRTLIWTQPAGMTHARLMIGYEMKFTDAHTVRVDDLSFTDDSIVVNGPALASAVSRRAHGGGTFDINVPLSGAPATEPRQNGPTPQVLLTFDGAIEATDGTVNCGQEVAVVNGACQGASISGSTLTVNMNFDANTCPTVTLSGLRGAGGGPATTGDNDVQVRAFEGEVTGDTAVNLLDLQVVKTNLFAAVGAGNFTSDVNADGAINLLDLQAIKGNLFQAAPCPSVRQIP